MLSANRTLVGNTEEGRLCVFSHKFNQGLLRCLAHRRRVYLLYIYTAVKCTATVVQNTTTARRGVGFMINVHAVLRVWYVFHCPAFHSSPVSPYMSVSPFSAGRRGVTWCAEEDQWHAGGDSEEDGQPVQTRQHLRHRGTAPGWAQLCYQQVRWVFPSFYSYILCQSELLMAITKIKLISTPQM